MVCSILQQAAISIFCFGFHAELCVAYMHEYKMNEHHKDSRPPFILVLSSPARLSMNASASASFWKRMPQLHSAPTDLRDLGGSTCLSSIPCAYAHTWLPEKHAIKLQLCHMHKLLHATPGNTALQVQTKRYTCESWCQTIAFTASTRVTCALHFTLEITLKQNVLFALLCIDKKSRCSD